MKTMLITKGLLNLIYKFLLAQYNILNFYFKCTLTNVTVTECSIFIFIITGYKKETYA